MCSPDAGFFLLSFSLFLSPFRSVEESSESPDGIFLRLRPFLSFCRIETLNIQPFDFFVQTTLALSIPSFARARFVCIQFHAKGKHRHAAEEESDDDDDIDDAKEGDERKITVSDRAGRRRRRKRRKENDSGEEEIDNDSRKIADAD
jgi:hypothetical protein